MTDIAPDTGTDFADNDGASVEPTGTTVNWEERYRAEVADRRRDRERYKPIAEAFGNLHPDDSAAIQEFVTAFASGDTETATRWMIDNAKTLAGERFNDYISPQAQATITHQAIADAQSAGLSSADVEKLVEQRLEQYQQAQIVSEYEKQIEQTLVENGLDPQTPLATAAIVAASRRSDLDLAAAIREMEDQVLSQAQEIANRRANAGTQMATPIVNGVPAVNPNGQNMSPRERALARLQQNGI